MRFMGGQRGREQRRSAMSCGWCVATASASFPTDVGADIDDLEAAAPSIVATRFLPMSA